MSASQTKTGAAQFGMIGLALMGRNLAMNGAVMVGELLDNGRL